ncbi:pentatricopeptide repeat-containing protein At2g02980, chloroplastic-like [Castanea sativa]|uniref:pentatricopeptide repeat-containing protein At2g02980, chloroplastic-like n=1 Tax=Castanea sativa TaxID=21020 RepID=UPI003F650959
MTDKYGIILGIKHYGYCDLIELVRKGWEMRRCELFEETDERQGGGEDLLRALDKLVKELKLVGYVPDISLVFHADLEDEDKEITLRYHSKKLAIAFGLLNSSPGTKIQVVKNLCGDCLYTANWS